MFVMSSAHRHQNLESFAVSSLLSGAWGTVVVKALRYYSDGLGIYSRWCHCGFFPWLPLKEPCALGSTQPLKMSIVRAERDGTRAETRFRFSPKWTCPFKSVGASVQSTTRSRGVRISSSNGSNAGQTTFRGKVDLYWLPTPFARFPFTSSPVRHRVPPGSERALQGY